MRLFCRFYYCLAWFDTVEFNRLPCPNDKQYDDVVFVDRSRYQLTMFGFRELIRLSRLLHTHIAYEKILPKSSQHSAEIPVVCMIWCSWIQSCHVRSTRWTTIWISLIDSDINWLCLWVYIDRLSRLLDTRIAYEIVIYKITTGNWHDVGNDLSCTTVVKR